MLIHAVIMALMQLSLHLIRPKNKAARGHARAGRNQHRTVPSHLVHGGAAHLPDRFGDAVHAVQVSLPELAAVRVERKDSAQLDSAARDEVPGLAPAAESKLLELHEYIRGEMVVQYRGANVSWADPRLPPQLAGDDAHLRQASDVAAVVARHRELVWTAALRRGTDHDRRILRRTGPLRAGHQHRDRAVGFLTAVKQPQRLADPPRLLVIGQ